MKKRRLVVSLTNDDNDYQIEQATSAQEACRRLGADLEIIYADNDAVNQSQQVLKVIQSSKELPDAILFEPVGGTALPQVARAAAVAGIGWVVLNRDVDYIPGLRQLSSAPIFAVTSDHEEIGRIQGRQFAALLPHRGSVLYIQGPAESSAAKQRTAGMYETKPIDLQMKLMKAQWTEASSFRAVSSWLRLATSHQTQIDVVAAQDDSMALGARKAFQDLPEGPGRERWVTIPFLGCDGLPKTGQMWVKKGWLAATIYVPANTGLAIEMLMKSWSSGVMPPERTMTTPISIPSLEALRSAQAERERNLLAQAAAAPSTSRPRRP